MGDPRSLDYGPGRVLDVLGYGSHVFFVCGRGGSLMFRDVGSTLKNPP